MVGSLPGRVLVAVGLGSNLGDREANLRFAFEGLTKFLEGLRCSPVYRTAPRYLSEQPRFLNACCIGRTGLAPRQLLATLQDVERAAGRSRKGRRYGPRVLDLDLLLYGSEMVDEPDLVVPHPLMHERAFVLIPLRDIAPDWHVPEASGKGATVAELATAVSPAGVRRTNLKLEDG